jgi:formylmethanofuran dehydrogenase subunit B
MPGRGQGRHSRAWIEGAPCPLDEAIEAAASRLRRSRQAVFAGLGCDIEGARMVVRLARLAGAAIDHLAGTGYGHLVEVARDAGMFLTTPGEARVRADTILIVGQGAFGAGSEFLGRLLETAPKLAGIDHPRGVIWLGGKQRPNFHSPRVKFASIPVPASRIAALLAALRARLAGRPTGAAPLSAARLDAILEKLRQAKFGVAIWSSADLEPLAVETLAGLVRDLNQGTRFSCLPIGDGDNAAGVAMALTWLTGFPSNIGFARGEADHDPWRFDAARLALSGEADLALWISAYRDRWPDWAGDLPVIALTPRGGAREKRRALIEIEVGMPGVDHDTIDLSATTGGLAFRSATAPGKAPSVAEIVGEICAALVEAGRALR